MRKGALPGALGRKHASQQKRKTRRLRKSAGFKNSVGARERTRTFTAAKPPAPEAGASTNFATRATEEANYAQTAVFCQEGSEK